MSITFKGPDQIAADYLTELKALKPEVNTGQTDSDWWVRGQVIGGVVSGAEADISAISDDAFPQSARHDAIEQHLITYFGSGFIPAQPAVGTVLVTAAASGQTFPNASQLIYGPNGNVYQSTATVALGTATTGFVPVQSVASGQSQNLLQGSLLTIPSPPAGFQSTATVVNGDISDGRDMETDQEAVARILARIRQPFSGGTASDYQQFALEADPSVTSANVLRYPFGLGTVGVIITSGTTNIDAAIDNNEAIVRIPSQSLIDKVSAFIQTVKPLTDCVTVFGPNEIPIDVTFLRRFINGINPTDTEPTTGLTYDALLVREITRVLYKIPIGGRNIAGSGFVLASEIEEGVDDQLSAAPYGQGLITAVLADRQCQPLSSSGYNRGVLNNQIFKPGVITLGSF